MKLWDLAMALRPAELLLMGGIFVGIAVRALSPRRRSQYQDNGMIPLRDDDVGERQ